MFWLLTLTGCCNHFITLLQRVLNRERVMDHWCAYTFQQAVKQELITDIPLRLNVVPPLPPPLPVSSERSDDTPVAVAVDNPLCINPLLLEDDWDLDFPGNLDAVTAGELDKKMELFLEYGVETFYSPVTSDADGIVEIVSYQPSGFVAPSAFWLKPHVDNGKLFLTVSSNEYLKQSVVLEAPEVYEGDPSQLVQRAVVLLFYELRQRFRSHPVHQLLLDASFQEVSEEDRRKIKNTEVVSFCQVFAQLLFEQFLQTVTQ